jgi:class 3 adenylate cyclase/tetratricopeptide (TPR) repeat protein
MDNKEGRKFCRQCGASLLGCPKCGFVNEPGDMFCGDCGEPLQEAASPTAAAPTPTAVAPPAAGGGELWGRLQNVVSQRVINNILTEFKQHVGERRNVTIVMADISGYTTLSESFEPEEATEIVTVFFEHWVPIIYKYEAHVHKFVGDQILALFGAPIALEDAPQRALRACLEMRESLTQINQKVNQKFPRRLGDPLSAHIGVSTGIVAWGEVGPDRSIDVMGIPVNVAARLEHLSQAGEILISEDTARAGVAGFELASKGKVSLQGIGQDIEVFQLVGTQGISAPERAVRFVGRGKEMAVVKQVLDEVKQGNKRIIAVVGDAGIGKTRFVTEFVCQAEEDKATVLQAHCLSYGGNMAYLPFAGLIRRFMRIEDGDPEAGGLRKIEGQLGRLGCPREDVHSWGVMLGYQASSAALSHLRADERQGAIFRATLRFLSGLADQGPTVVFLDDVQWIDETSRELLELLLREMDGKPVMFVLAFRPDLHHSWGALQGYREIPLERLSDQDSEQLLDALLSRYSLDGRAKKQVLARSQGNPLCMVEIVRSLQEAGGASLSDEALENLLKKIPGTLWDIIMARIDVLEPGLKELVRAASVVGREIPKQVLADVLGLAQAELDKALARLNEVEILGPKSGLQELWEFEHPLAQEVAYESLILADRRRLHVRVGEATERLYGDEAKRLKAEVLARHYYEGRQPDKAAEYNSLAAERGRENFAYPEALRFCERSLEMLETVPPSDKAREVRIRALRTQGLVWQFQGKAQEAKQNFIACLRLARETRNLKLLADAHYNVGHADFSLGEVETAKEYFTMALRLWRDLGVDDEVARSHVGIGTCLYFLGNHEGALEHFEESTNLLRELGIPEDPSAVNNAGDIYMSMGDFDRAVEAYQKALELSRARGREDKRGEAYASLNLAVALESQGDYVASLEPARRALALAEQMGERFLVSLVNCEMAHFLFHLGTYQEALQHGEKALLLAEEIGNQEYAWQAKAFLARIWAELGEEDKAVALLDDAAEGADRAGIRRILALASWVRAEILGPLLRDWQASAQHYHKARLIFQRLKTNKDEAIMALGCFGAQGRLGQFEKADLDCREVLDKLEKMGSKDGMVTALFTLAQVWEAAERPTTASDYYRRCWELAERIEDPSFCWKALVGLSRTVKAQGEEPESAEYHRLAERAAGSILANLRDPQLRQTFSSALEKRAGLVLAQTAAAGESLAQRS